MNDESFHTEEPRWKIPFNSMTSSLPEHRSHKIDGRKIRLNHHIILNKSTVYDDT